MRVVFNGLFLTSITIVCAHANAQSADYAIKARQNYAPARIVKYRDFGAGRNCRGTRIWAEAPDPVTGHLAKFGYVLFTPSATLTAPKGAPSGVLIFPNGGAERPGPWIGTYQERWFGRDFCSRGVPAAVLLNYVNPSDGTLDIKSHDDILLRAYVAGKRVALHFKSNYNVLGISGGGILTALFMAIERRVTAGTLIASAFPFSEVLVQTSQIDARKLRTARMAAKTNYDLEDYRRDIRQHLTLDPLRVGAKTLAQKPAFMVIAGKDTTMPTALQWQTSRAFKRVTTVEDKNWGHILTSGMVYTKHRTAIMEFMVSGYLASPGSKHSK